jgi:hypothetical protein
MIIGVCGFIGSGKDTVADYLVNNYNFKQQSYAGSLKDAVAYVFGWDRIMLEGRTKQAREWREQVDPWWAERLKMPNLTPRLILQHWGTEVCRHGFHDDIWIASLENKLRNGRDSVVISDCRFPNEITSIKAQGGIVVRVLRGPEPSWLEHAKNYMAGENGNIGWSLGKRNLDLNNIHASEYSWVNTEFDAVLDNNGTLDDLYKQVTSLATSHLDAMADQTS